MKIRTSFWVPTLLVAAALILASCGGNADGGNDGMEGMGHGGSGGGETSQQKTTGGGMAGMDHSNMDHGSMGSKDIAREMVMEDGKYSDRAFIPVIDLVQG